MGLWEDIIKIYPELTDTDFDPLTGLISLRDDSDGYGPYIAKWEYYKPLPEGMSVGKGDLIS